MAYFVQVELNPSETNTGFLQVDLFSINAVAANRDKDGVIESVSFVLDGRPYGLYDERARFFMEQWEKALDYLGEEMKAVAPQAELLSPAKPDPIGRRKRKG